MRDLHHPRATRPAKAERIAQDAVIQQVTARVTALGEFQMRVLFLTCQEPAEWDENGELAVVLDYLEADKVARSLSTAEAHCYAALHKRSDAAASFFSEGSNPLDWRDGRANCGIE